MTSMIAATQSLDLVSLGTNLGIFLGFIVAAVLGLKRGVKIIDKTEAAPIGSAKVTVDGQVLTLWSDASRNLADSLTELRNATNSLREALASHALLTLSHQRELAELRHEIELLRSQMR